VDKLTIDLIAKQITNGILLDHWYLLMIWLCLTVIATAVGTYFAAYLKTRANNFATKADFNELLTQQASIKETTAKIEQSVSHKDWTIKEYKTVRRIKLEELLLAIHECDVFMDKQRLYALNEGPRNDLIEPIHRIFIIGQLYFPELAQHLSTFTNCYLEYKTYVNQAGSVDKAHNLIHAEEIVQKLGDRLDKVYIPFWSAVVALDHEAQDLMQKIIRVEA